MKRERVILNHTGNKQKLYVRIDSLSGNDTVSRFSTSASIDAATASSDSPAETMQDMEDMLLLETFISSNRFKLNKG